MAEANWQKVREVFDAAMREKPAARQPYITDVCGDDQELLIEVESLIASIDSCDDFMEVPAVAAIADIIESETKLLEKGRCVGHYEILRQVGSGGMGQVYLAHDKKLDRQVAIKILNEEFSRHESNLQRFVREAKTASALDHPNILVIHEIGQSADTHYIVTEFIKGLTLRELLKDKAFELSEVLDVSIQIANALSVAHEAHLVHRDIKPENIMIRPDGYVKVLDFGLAKLVEQKTQSFLALEGATGKQNQTARGVILGTVNYMSPEQAKAEWIDERTDIFSLGVVIYEMIAGRTPFGQDSMSETFANLINAEPEPLSRFVANAPEDLIRIVSKMLHKNRDERYQTMQEILTDLKDLRTNLPSEEQVGRSHLPETENATAVWQATTGDVDKRTAKTQYSFSHRITRHRSVPAFALVALLVGVIALGYVFYARKASSRSDGNKSLAVLPLKPLNSANRDELYEIGIADSLILKLSSMKVRPLSATRKYAAIERDPLAAGREQQVDYVLVSNYQLAGGKIKVTAQLLNVASGRIEETYQSEKDVAHVFAMQDAIAGEIGTRLLSRFATTSRNSTGKRGTTNEEAYRLYLLGMNLYDKRIMADAQNAVGYLDQAIKLDPNYAVAWAGKAHAHRSVANFIGTGGSANNRQEHQKSIEAINKALALDENLSEAHSALCENKYFDEYDFYGAERECKRAIELDANSSLAHQIYSRYLVLQGRFDEAIAEVKVAIDLEPASLFNQRNYGVALYYSRRYPEAVVQLKRVIEMDPNFSTAYFWLWNSLRMQGNHSEAFEWFMKRKALQKTDDGAVQLFRKAYERSGWRGVLRAEISNGEKGGYLGFYDLASFNAQIENKDKAFEYLEKAYQRHEGMVSYLQVAPSLDSLRGDPRFDEMVKRVGLK